MFHYAQINDSDIVDGVITCNVQQNNDKFIEISNHDISIIGKRHQYGAFLEVEEE